MSCAAISTASPISPVIDKPAFLPAKIALAVFLVFLCYESVKISKNMKREQFYYEHG